LKTALLKKVRDVPSEKFFRGALLFAILILVTTNVFTYIYLRAENSKLMGELYATNMYYRQASAELGDLKISYERLNKSYYEVLEANRGLEKALKAFHAKLIVPYNYTLMTQDEFYANFTFAYSKEMKEFVLEVTGGWDGSEDDFLSDLYRIYKAWHDAFSYNLSASPYKNLTFINIGSWNYYRTDMGDEYLAEIGSIDTFQVPVTYAELAFRYKTGGCYDYALCLVALYYTYYDAVGKSLPTCYLSIGIREMFHHGCVLIKGDGDKIAIVDWEVITGGFGKLAFLPFEEAKALHERYWFGREISYDGILERPYIVKRFSSNEEFYRWLVEDFV
jgi:hypothetical protein